MLRRRVRADKIHRQRHGVHKKEPGGSFSESEDDRCAGECNECWRKHNQPEAPAQPWQSFWLVFAHFVNGPTFGRDTCIRRRSAHRPKPERQAHQELTGQQSEEFSSRASSDGRASATVEAERDPACSPFEIVRSHSFHLLSTFATPPATTQPTGSSRRFITKNNRAYAPAWMARHVVGLLC